MTGVASLAPGFVAVGMRFGVNPAAAPSANGQPRVTGQGIAWRSSDGVAWEMLPDDPALPLGTSESGLGVGLISVLARDGAVIAVGATGADGALLFFGTPAGSPAP